MSATLGVRNTTAATRDPGVPWLGAFPAHWRLTRLKYVARVQTGIALGKDFGKKALVEYPYLRVANVQDGFIDLNDVKTIMVPEQEASLCRLRKGDVLMNEGGDADKLGRGAVWLGEIEPCLHQNHVFAVRPWSVSSEWLAIWISCEQAKGYFASRAKQATNLASISSTNLMELPILLPPPERQRAIVAHIARETGRIDALVSAKQRLIGTLAEKRRAVVALAVTRGLDSAAPLRRSAVPSLGVTPAHWRDLRLRFLLERLEQGWSPEAENREPGHEEWGVLKLNAVSRGQYDGAATKALPASLKPRPELQIEVGDVLVTRANTPLLVGDACYVAQTRPRLMLCDLIYRLRVRPRDLDGRYLSLFLITAFGRAQVESVAKGTSGSMVKISQDHIKDWWIPVPPLEEQRAIVAHIARETSKIDQLRAATERTIALLKERRAALIAAAVTGQIDVTRSAP